MFNFGKYDFYLGGPMRGYKALNKPMFIMVANMLRKKGFKVWNPAEHDSYLHLSFAQCMTADLDAVVNKCRKIVFLPGWKSSLGANMEAFAAFACGKDALIVVMSDDHTDFELVPFDLSRYSLPYEDGDTKQFDPHKCSLDSFTEK